jgi:hypothetical protein
MSTAAAIPEPKYRILNGRKAPQDFGCLPEFRKGREPFRLGPPRNTPHVRTYDARLKHLTDSGLSRENAVAELGDRPWAPEMVVTASELISLAKNPHIVEGFRKKELVRELLQADVNDPLAGL